MEQYPNTEHPSVDLLIARVLGNTATADECRQLEDWISENDKNLVCYKQSKALWDSALHLDTATEQSLEKALTHIQPKRQKRRILPLLQKIAAIFFLPLLLGTLLLLHQLQEKHVQTVSWIQTTAAFGSLSQLRLPDGSKVWLNTGSTISYPEKFATGERTIKLEGEAYFEVTSDVNNPFVVQTPHFTVTATGTRFSIMAYNGITSKQVTLAEGKVAVRGFKHHNEILMKPNQNLRIDVLKGNTLLEDADAYKYYAWKDGKIIFRNDRLIDIANRLSLQYNADIEIQGDIKDLRFRATFENETLGEVLTLLKLASPFMYVERAPQYQADGTFTRRKIIIKAISNLK